MKKLKQLAIISLLTFSIFICTNLISNAVTTGKVTTETVRLRKSSSTDSTVLELISKGEQVEIIEEVENWYKIKYKKITGYVHKDYIEVKENIENSNSNEEKEENKDIKTEENTNNEQTENNEQPTEVKTVVKLKNDSNLYIHPTINSLIIKDIKQNTQIDIISKLNNWVYIVSENAYGWIPYNDIQEEKTTVNVELTQDTVAETVQPIEEQKQETKEEQPLNKTGYINTDGINFREQPNTDSKVIRVFVTNAKVNILKEEGEWYKVTYKEKTGYVLKTYVSSKQVSTTSRGAETRSQEVIKTTKQVEESKKEENISQKTVSSTGSKGQDIVNLAKSYLGCKYVYGGASPSGFDCSGFTMYLYKKYGISLPHSATAQSKIGTKVAKSDLQLGDLVFFSNYRTYTGIGHVGIYIGDNKFIHASTEKTGVITSSLTTTGYVKRYVTAIRVF